MYEFDEEKHIERILSSQSARAVMKEQSTEEYKQQNWRRRGTVLSCGRHRERDRRENIQSEPAKSERRYSSRRHRGTSSEPFVGPSEQVVVILLKNQGGAVFNPKPGDEVFVEQANPENDKSYPKPAHAEVVHTHTPSEKPVDQDYVVHLSAKLPCDK